jgi:FkbM family methyltransferase
MNNREMQGLMVDANPETIEGAQWHIKTNHLVNVHVLHGLIGAENKSGLASFFLHTSNVCSTAIPPEATMNKTNTWKRIQAPCVNLDEKWQSIFGNMPCDLLKVDIEGSEMDFFRNEPAFLQRSRVILIEWHKWRVTFAEVETFLSEQGFVLKKILHDGSGLGTALFVRAG